MKQTTSRVKHLFVLLLALAVYAGGLVPSSLSQQRAKSAQSATRLPAAQSASKTTSNDPAPAAQDLSPGDDFHVRTLAPDPPGKIAFASDRAGNFDIYVMNPDGSGIVRLTNDPAEDTQPTWSPDGRQIAFVSNRDGNKEIYVINADGGGLTRLTNNTAEDFSPAWSPATTPQKIAFVSHRDGNDEIYLMNTDGSSQTNLTLNNSDDDDPAWAPSGTMLAFASNREGDKFEIYRVNTDMDFLTRLTNNFSNDVAPTWAPGRITYQSDRDGVNDELYTSNAADGSNAVRITINTAFDLDPARSSDGARIVFVSNRDAATNLEIYAANADGSNTVRLTNDPASDIDPAIQPLPSAATLGTVQLSASTYSVSEGQRTLDITVTRTGGSGAASVELSSIAGSASDRTDFIPIVRTLRFNAGETSKTVRLSVIDDFRVEGDETLTVTLARRHRQSSRL
jgi:Tol biopolymer transport system component